MKIKLLGQELLQMFTNVRKLAVRKFLQLKWLAENFLK
jgi:hypothetical protein